MVKAEVYACVQQKRARQASVLLVEDDRALSGALEMALSQKYRVTCASDGPGALARIQQERFDVILLDVILPRGTGLSVLSTLASQPGPASPVVVMSALGASLDLSHFSGLVAGLLVKPFGLDAVERLVESALAGTARPPTVKAFHRGAHVLLVDDEPELLESMAEYLSDAGYRVRTASSGDAALTEMAHHSFELIICDWIMPNLTGLDLMAEVKRRAPALPVLLLTGYGSPDFVKQAVEAGAADVLVKPFLPRVLSVAIEKCLHRAAVAPLTPVAAAGEAVRQRTAARPQAATRYTEVDIAGESEAIRLARHALRRAAPLDSSVLVLGETGTGKELFAQAVHGLSPRGGSPFVAVNAAAIPETLLESELFGYAAGAFTGARKEGHRGKFQLADGGTLFLDEIGDLPLMLQSKLLRVLQEGEIDQVGGGSKRVNVRLIAATHRNLPEMVAQGKFRADLFYRLNVVTLELPPLRERAGDIPVLAGRFLSSLRERYGRPHVRLSPEVLELFERYSWPGNVRELANVVERAFAYAPGELIMPVHLPHTVKASAAEPTTPVNPEAVLDLPCRDREAIIQALQTAGGNKVQAAKLLGISRAGLYIKLKVYGIQ